MFTCRSCLRIEAVAIVAAVTVHGCSAENASSDSAAKTAKSAYEQVGTASWYGPGFHGKETANGETFNQYDLTAAHRSLPLGTEVEVTNIKNGKSVEVEINDRGPYVGGRVIDLSHAAAVAIGIKDKGVAKVKIEADALSKKSGRIAKGESTDKPN